MFAIGLRARFIAKHTLFKPPLGWLMRWFGGIPVNREAPQGMVPQAVEAIEQGAVACSSPSRRPGTRSSTKPWKSGFYRIAVAARVPIMPIAFDGEHTTRSASSRRSSRAATTTPTCRSCARFFEGVRGIKP